MKLHHLRPAKGSKKRKIRVGRGEGGRRGKTAGRGTKGLKARSKVRQGFEGGQTPLQRRIPKLKGFNNPNRVEFTVVNVERLADFESSARRSRRMIFAKQGSSRSAAGSRCSARAISISPSP